MVDQVAFVEFDTPSSTGDFNITSSSITETVTAAIFLVPGNAAESTDAVHGVMCVGVLCTDGGTGGAANENASFCTQGSNSAALTIPDYNVSRRAGTTARCLNVVSGTNVLVTLASATFVTTISGGITINFDVALSGIKVRCILFAGLAGAWVDTHSSALASGSVVLGDGSGVPAFRPDVLFFFGGGNTTNTQASDCQLNLGWAVDTSPLQQASAFVNIDDVTEPTDADGMISTDSMSHFEGSTRNRKDFTITSINNDGFSWSLDPSGAPAYRSMFLALKFSGSVRKACAAMAISSSTGEQTFTGFNFNPGLVFGMTTLLATADSETDGATAGAGGVFITGNYGSGAVTIHGEEGKTNVAAASFNTHNRSETVALLCYEHTGTVAQRATWAGPSGSTGFKLNFTVATTGHMVALGIALGLSEADAEQISDATDISVGLATADTEEIGDSVVLSGAGAIVVSDIEEISDEYFRVAETADRTAANPSGWTYTGGAERGGTFQGGAEAGTVL